MSAPVIELQQTVNDDSKEYVEQQLFIFKLLFAASRGDIHEMIELVKGREFYPNNGDYDRRTPLHLAASEGHLHVVQYIVALIGKNKEKYGQGDNWINQEDRFGRTALDDSIKFGHHAISDFLRSNGAKTKAGEHECELMNAASTGNIADVKRLLESKVNPNSKDYDKRTPMHVAAGKQEYEIVQLLLDHKADPTAEDIWGGTPLKDANRTAPANAPTSSVAVAVCGGNTNKVISLIKNAMGMGMENNGMAMAKPKKHGSIWNDFTLWTYVLFQSAMIVLYALFCTYAQPTGTAGVISNIQRYPMFQDVHVMVFVGFGLLMTFLRKYGYSAVALSMMIAVIVMQVHPLLKQFWTNVFDNNWKNNLAFDVGTLLSADFASVAVLITFGALLGKTTPVQMMLLAMIEPIFYSLNEEIGIKLNVSDIGGSMGIHCFGTFFGLACSWIMTPDAAKGSDDNKAVYYSNILAMIGTLFLWIYYPSFNAGFADGEFQNRAIVNTLLALCTSCFSAFMASYCLRGERKFCMADIQNATLAGGVGMGTCANMMINPATALAIGISTGTMTVVGYTKIQPALERWIGLHDTCGVLNLHGVPSIMAGIYGAIASRYSGGNGGYQFSFLLITFGLSIVSGLIVGWFVRMLNVQESFFLDEMTWEIPELELGAGRQSDFDKIRENTRQNDENQLDIEKAGIHQSEKRKIDLL
jgi:ammonium transporter Rh